MFRELEIKLAEYANTELAATWLSETLSTITSNVFIKLTICIARVSFMFHTPNEDRVRGWNSVDNVLDRLSLCEDVTLVIRLQDWVVDDTFKGLVERYFPLMWENGRIVLEGPIGWEAIRRMQTSDPVRSLPTGINHQRSEFSKFTSSNPERADDQD